MLRVGDSPELSAVSLNNSEIERIRGAFQFFRHKVVDK